MNHETSTPFHLHGRRIIVTGATSGLGLATALACARMGAQVLGIGRDPERLASSLQQLKSISDKTHEMLHTDLPLARDRERLVAHIGGPVP